MTELAPPYPDEAQVPKQFKDKPFDELPPGPQDRIRKALEAAQATPPAVP